MPILLLTFTGLLNLSRFRTDLARHPTSTYPQSTAKTTDHDFSLLSRPNVLDDAGPPGAASQAGAAQTDRLEEVAYAERADIFGDDRGEDPQ
jgi:hypothetical protein